jgi:hypothetical protein
LQNLVRFWNACFGSALLIIRMLIAIYDKSLNRTNQFTTFLNLEVVYYWDKKIHRLLTFWNGELIVYITAFRHGVWVLLRVT